MRAMTSRRCKPALLRYNGQWVADAAHIPYLGGPNVRELNKLARRWCDARNLQAAKYGPPGAVTLLYEAAQ